MVLWSPVKKSLLELPESGLRFYSSSILIIYEASDIVPANETIANYRR